MDRKTAFDQLKLYNAALSPLQCHLTHDDHDTQWLGSSLFNLSSASDNPFKGRIATRCHVEYL